MDKVEERKLKAKFLHAGQIKHLFAHSTCVVPISVGQPYHEGKYFEETLGLIRRNFKACTIIVCDTLQRHTMKLLDDRDDREIDCQSVKNGHDWIKRNTSAIEQLNIPYDLMHWEIWRNHHLYPMRVKEIDTLFNTDQAFHDMMQHTAETFLERLEKRHGTIFDHQQALKYSLAYLKEEMAVMPLWVEKGFAFEIYPKERPPAMQLSYERFVQPTHPHLLKRLAIKFSH
jgi:tRNA-dependent cyclodipeptide synthase